MYRKLWFRDRNKSSFRKVAEKFYRNLKFGRFSKGKYGDDKKIRENWSKLISIAGVKSSKACLLEFMNLDNSDFGRMRQNILGTYLGHNLPHIRFGADVFQHSVTLLCLNASGRYSQEETKLILEAVETSGSHEDTWKQLSKQLSRPWYNIVRFYSVMKMRKGTASGKWSNDDFKIFFGILFRDASGPESIQSVSHQTLLEAAKALGRSGTFCIYMDTFYTRNYQRHPSTHNFSIAGDGDSLLSNVSLYVCMYIQYMQSMFKQINT
jgi:hypothetical protein